MSTLFVNPAQIPEAKVPKSEAACLTWLRLMRSENVGPITFLQLINRYDTVAEALAALPDLAARGGRRRFSVCTVERAEAEWEAATRAGAHMLCLGAPDYPRLLAEIDAPPPLLWARGRRLEAERVIGIVGARNASAVGTKVATMLASGLAARGFAVISGLARGIDTAAHTATLEGEGDTAAVLAGGVDHIYPAENTALYHRIADHGLLLSEMPMRFEPQARNFPRRNRIISGMAEGVLVIEAAERSGSLITARYAGEQGREAMAVPGNPLDPRAGGCNRLIREGAALIRHVEDVVEALAGLASHVREPSASYGAPATRIDQDLAALRQRLLDLLSPAPIETDELVRQARASPAEVAWALMELELAGAVTREPGGRVSRLL